MTWRWAIDIVLVRNEIMIPMNFPAGVSEPSNFFILFLY